MKIPLWHSVTGGSRLVEGFARNALALAGGVGAVVTFISMITSEALRGWVLRNPYTIFIALIVAVVIIMVLLNQLRDLTRQNSDHARRGLLRDPDPTEHDRQLFAHFASVLRSDSIPMRWLKQEFSPESLPWEPVHALEEAVRRLDLNPIGFDDQSVSVAYTGFRSAVEDFRQKVQSKAKANAQNTSFEVPDDVGADNPVMAADLVFWERPREVNDRPVSPPGWSPSGLPCWPV